MRTFVPTFIAVVLLLAVTLCPAWRVTAEGTATADVMFRPLWYSFNPYGMCPPEMADLLRKPLLSPKIAWDVMAVVYLCIGILWGFGMVAMRLAAKASVLLCFCVLAHADPALPGRYSGTLRKSSVLPDANVTTPAIVQRAVARL